MKKPKKYGTKESAKAKINIPKRNRIAIYCVWSNHSCSSPTGTYAFSTTSWAANNYQRLDQVSIARLSHYFLIFLRFLSFLYILVTDGLYFAFAFAFAFAFTFMVRILNLGFPILDSRFLTRDSRLTTRDSQLATHNSRLTTRDSQFTTEELNRTRLKEIHLRTDRMWAVATWRTMKQRQIVERNIALR
jgi:hypothetical protein